MAVLEPKLAILDETDSVSTSTRSASWRRRQCLRNVSAMLVITHYQRSLQ